MIPSHVLLATGRCEDAIGDLNTGHEGMVEKREAAAFVRQHLICVMSYLEQTGIDAALSSAIEAYDLKLKQEGLA